MKKIAALFAVVFILALGVYLSVSTSPAAQSSVEQRVAGLDQTAPCPAALKPWLLTTSYSKETLAQAEQALVTLADSQQDACFYYDDGYSKGLLILSEATIRDLLEALRAELGNKSI